MDKTESGGSSEEKIGSVKEAVNFYGGRITRGKQDFNRKLQMPFSEKPPSRARELHIVKKDISQLSENRKVAEDIRSQAESELFSAKKTVKDLSLRIEESKSKARARKWELETLKRQERNADGQALTVAEVDNHQYAEVMRELESVKQELSKLKLDMTYLLETKSRADKETEASTSRMRSYSSSIESLRKDIEEANEEQVLAELAKIEAFREFGAIEAQRKAEATEFASTMEKTRKKMKELVHEIDHSKELEMKLAITNSDIAVLQNELKLVKAVGESFERKETSGEAGVGELEAANKELACIRDEGFQFMSSMDIIRDELKHVCEETARLKNLEKKADSTVQILNHKLLRAKSKLESVSTAEEKAKAIVTNLSATLQQLTTEAEAAKKERELITETATNIREETQKIETEIDLAEERLHVAMKELEEVKASEALALDNLKNLSEKTMRARASASQHNSSITVTQFEYKYLSGRAEGVEEIADKKVAAAQAWIEALKASEKEILMKTEIALREMRELKLVEEQQELDKQDREQGKFIQQRERVKKNVNLQIDMALPRKSIKDNESSTPKRKSMKDNGNFTPLRKANLRKPSSPGARNVNHSGSITLKRRRKVVPNLVKFFGSKS